MTLTHQLTAEDLTLAYGDRLVVEELALEVAPGRITAIVGANGCGKSTLLRALARLLSPKSGQIVLDGLELSSRPTKEIARLIGLLPQSPIAPEGIVVADLIGRGRHPHQRVFTRWSRADDEAVAAALDATGIADLADRPVDELSGGQRQRAWIAMSLAQQTDVLLLDEPTNHLDSDAKTWLLGFLRSYRGALLVVSHDLALLDEAITRILHLDEDRLVEYRGTYSAYRAARARDEERQAKQAAADAAEITRLSTLADRMRGQTARRARQAKSLDTRVARLRATATTGPTRERALRLRLPPPPHSGRVALEVEGLAKGYGGPPVFEDLTFDVGRGERLLVLGLNGAGKTSLLRILAGTSTPDAGTVRLGFGVSLGYYAQEHEGVVAGRSVLSHVAEAGSPEQPLRDQRGLLGMFGLTGDKADQDAGTLSGGEKTRLALAVLVAGRHNLLLLDEPTNNLDPPSRAAAADALGGWGGAMVLVSHDPEFVQALRPDRVLLMPDGDVDHWSDEVLDLVALA
jgi:ATPase subunit of ABC transporter with duplicated ATPase domains